jgi:hypothetical protein
MAKTTGKPAATAADSEKPRETVGQIIVASADEPLVNATDRRQTVVGCHRQTDKRQRSALSAVVLSIAMVVCAAAIDWEQTTDVCRYWISMAVELVSVADQKVPFTHETKCFQVEESTFAGYDLYFFSSHVSDLFKSVNVDDKCFRNRFKIL